MAKIVANDRKRQLGILKVLLRKTKSTYEDLVRRQELHKADEDIDAI